MSSSQFSDKPQNINSAQLNPAAPPPVQWNVPPGVPGYNLSPNPQMWNAPTAQQWNPQAPQQWNNPIITVTPQMTQSTMFHQEFLKGKPKALGITLIIVGIIHIGMGFGQIFTSSLTAIYSGIPFWGAIFNIIAGSLSVAAVSKPSMCLVGGHVLRGIFILTYLLQFSVSVSLSVFACRAQAHSNSTQPAQVFVIQNSAPVFQPSAVSGSYPTYPLQQPTPYMTQSGMGGGPTVYKNPSS
ncbi:membrane-spanning 4-domains subfamily A member 12-like isoform X2 [Rana temporaria]|uniref:membrane-spanning 4-domains subfamily A member 12-like isoform X2 n=1 Tax=Rana temporaria TaxID=8407 RepID=UPI001AAD90D6|nr:membrane-spanning 4-domains subfamily A member 12-like isoform X2 [Rana temporaria]